MAINVALRTGVSRNSLYRHANCGHIDRDAHRLVDLRVGSDQAGRLSIDTMGARRILSRMGRLGVQGWRPSGGLGRSSQKLTTGCENNA